MCVDLQKCSRFGINMCRSKHAGGEMQNNCSFKFCHVHKDHPNEYVWPALYTLFLCVL